MKVESEEQRWKMRRKQRRKEGHGTKGGRAVPGKGSDAMEERIEVESEQERKHPFIDLLYTSHKNPPDTVQPPAFRWSTVKRIYFNGKESDFRKRAEHTGMWSS